MHPRRLAVFLAGAVLLFAGAAALAVAPWCVKNILHYGNPLYPIFHEYFGGSPPASRA
ncbi:MAG: hypothetical protein HY812_00680 [Planctomycetes bacterium]|nr:hypothetical protein [Planctomycetota bacterium]